MSTRCVSMEGSTSILTEPSSLLGAIRWPSRSTSVRLGPKLRSDSVLPPLLVPPLPWLRGVRPPMMVGNLFNASAVSLGVVAWISAMSTEVSGVGDLTASVMVREPVTVMTPNSSPWPCSPCGGVPAPASCAQAELPPRAAETASATIDTRKVLAETIFLPLQLAKKAQIVPPVVIARHAINGFLLRQQTYTERRSEMRFPISVCSAYGIVSVNRHTAVSVPMGVRVSVRG